jgi:hypothetical protein
VKFTLKLQYRAPSSIRPDDELQDDQIVFWGSDAALIPAVGDAVVYKCGDHNKAFKVESRTFSYGKMPESDVADICTVRIVVARISEKELAARIRD